MIEVVYIGSGNKTRRVLQADNRDLTQDQKDAITRVVAYVGDIKLDTDVQDDKISVSEDVVEMQLGLVPAITPGTVTIKLTVFDGATPEGLAWGSFPVRVIDWPTND